MIRPHIFKARGEWIVIEGIGAPTSTSFAFDRFEQACAWAKRWHERSCGSFPALALAHVLCALDLST